MKSYNIVSRKNKLSSVALRLFTYALCLMPYACFPQNTTSPYSRYGIGEMHTPVFTPAFSMGGLGVAMQNDQIKNPFNINMINPASYAHTDSVCVFEVGGIVSSTAFRTASSDSASYGKNVNINYLAFLFPIKKWWASSLSLTPYSSVGYNLIDSRDTANIGAVDYRYTGNGGINRVNWGNGFRKGNFSLGVNASFLFGYINNIRTVSYPEDTSKAYDVAFEKSIRIRDLYLNYGMQYTIKIDSSLKKREKGKGKDVLKKRKELEDKIRIVLGATFAPSQNVKSSLDLFAYTFRYDAGIFHIRDTLQYAFDQKDKIRLPVSMAYGISFKKGNKWLIGTEYSSTTWSQYSMFGAKSELKNNMTARIGLQYIPGGEGKDKVSAYWRSVNYRAGFRYSDGNLQLKGIDISEYALSFGFGFPVAKYGMNKGKDIQYSMINVCVELGKSGTTDNGLIAQRFIKVMIGLTMNDRQWFRIRKID